MSQKEAPSGCGRRAWLRAVLGAWAATLPLRAAAQDGDAVPAFALHAADVAELHDRDGRLHIGLIAAARERFARFTGIHIGRPVRVTVGDIVLVETVVHSEIVSGRVLSRDLDDETRKQALRLLHGGSAP